MTRAIFLVLAFLCLAAAATMVAALVAARGRARELKRLASLLDAARVDDQDAGTGVPSFLAARFLRAGWEPSPAQILGLTGLIACAVILAGVFAGALAGLLAGITLIAMGAAVLQYRAGVNIRHLSDAMLGLLERVRQLLSVGNSLSVALARAVENSPPVVRRNLESTLRRIANGGGVADSIALTATELDLYELHLLGTAARTNLRFGGSMTLILKNIIETIRRRASIERELRANTTQIRASAWVLALLPMLVASIVMFTNRDYARWFLVTSAGHWMIGYAALSQVLGILVMRVITRTRY